MRIMLSYQSLRRLAFALTAVSFLVLALSGQTQESSPIQSVAWNNTGTKLAVGYESGLVEIVDASTRQILRSFHLLSVIQVSWSPIDSNTLAVSSAELDVPDALYILNTATGQQLLTLSDGDYFDSIGWKPDGSRIAAAVDFTTDPQYFRYVTVWNTVSGNVSLTIPFSPAGIHSLAWSPDGSHIAGGGGDNNVTIWNAETGSVVKTLVGHTYGVWSVSWSPDGSKLTSSGFVFDPTIRVWDVETAEQLLVIPSTICTSQVIWSPDGTRLAASIHPPEVRFWDAATGEIIESIPQTSEINTIAWSPDGTKIAVGGVDGILQIISASSPKSV